tara:strand:- start:1055 stop:2509 length:1455 start_codon:yes stop_codon:yes gene_type:complete
LNCESILKIINYKIEDSFNYYKDTRFWNSITKENFDSVFFHIDNICLYNVRNIIEILFLLDLECNIYIFDNKNRIYSINKSQLNRYFNLINKINQTINNYSSNPLLFSNEDRKSFIIFDGRVLTENKGSGIHRYARELLNALPTKIPQIDIKVIGCENVPIPKEVTKIPISLPFNDHDQTEKLLGLSTTLEFSRLIFSPYYPVPRERSGNAILTIHDLIPLVHPEWFTNPSTINFFKNNLRESALHADKIIADSYCTKNDIIKFYEIEDEKIEVIHLAPSLIFKNTAEWNPSLGKTIPEIITKNRPYFLSVATLEPRKNLVRTIKAFELFREREKSLKPALILVGKSGWKNEELLETFHKSKYNDSIFFTGYLNNEDLISVYQHALAFIYPSLYEGFGLPVLEAMSSGVPVITSNNSSLTEIATDAALCCDPYSVEEIAVSMEKIAESQTLRQNLAALGIQRSNKFSWEKTAKETAKVLLSCLN